MLKKLLASALAVATVATCAYVPAALASADTTTVTATAADYAGYKLTHPSTSTATTTTVKLRVLVNGTAVDGLIETNKFESADNNLDYIQANLTTLLKDKTISTAAVTIKGEKLDGEAYVDGGAVKKATVDAVYATGSEYLVSVSTYKEVQIAVLPKATYVASTDADKLTAGNVAVLGWYKENATDATLLAAAYASEYTAQTKIASQKFTSWTTDGKLVIANYVAAVEGTAETAPTGYTKIILVKANHNADAISKANMISGGYLANGQSYGSEALYVPTADSANWATYVRNYQLQNNKFLEDASIKTSTDAAKATDYTATGVAFVTKDDTKYAVVTYTVKAEETVAKNVTYTLTFSGAVTDNSTFANKKVETTTFTTDAAEIYALVKGTDDKATLDEYVAKDDTDAEKYYVDSWTTSVVSKVAEPGDDKNLGSVAVDVKVAVKTAYKVYYYDAEGVIAEATVYLTTKQIANLADGKLTAADLGIDASTSINGVEAKFKAAAKGDDKEVEVTYELGEATVDINDFETATGAFNATAYFGKKGATVGSEVMLKVALSDKGAAKGLQLKNVTVKYELVGATAGENYAFTPAEGDTRPAGVATNITLVEGTNIAIAVVYYNGVEVGKFAPFYTYVG
jgi:hypothetical protein